MEIIDFLNLTRARRVTLAVALIIGCLVTGVLVLRQSQKYDVSAVVFVGRVFSVSSFEAESYVADFTTALTLGPVLQQASEETGVPIADVQKGLTVDTQSRGALVKLIFRDDNADDAADVARAVGVAALETLANQDAARASQAVTAAEEELATATGALQSFQQRNGFDDLQAEISRRSDDILGLRNEIAQAVGTERAIALQALLSTKQGELDELTGLLPEFENLQSEIIDARQVKLDAQRAENAAEARVEAASAPGVVVVDEASQVGRLPVMVKSLVAAIVAIVVVFLVVISLLEIRRRRRETTEVEQVHERSAHTPVDARNAS